MGKKGLNRINLALAEVERGGPGNVYNLSKHVRNRCGGDPGFWTCCMTVAAIDGYDRETRAAVCARVHKIVTGKWPGEHRKRKADVEEKAGLVEIDLVITKANIGPDGEPRWLAVASDTVKDRTGERTSLGLFQDWAERIEKNLGVKFLPPPRKPFLGVSHYSDLEGFGEAGLTDKMYIDGQKFKAGGTFFTDDDHPLGPVLFQAVQNEREFIRRGGDVETPIRISAAWWDLQHAHGDFIFTRQSLDHKCPMCQKGSQDKVYLKGQLDHFATTRVPINPRTSLMLEEKSMATTRKEDAESIVGEDLAEELEKRSRLVGKSETEGEEEGLVIKADDEEEAKPETAEEKPKTRKKSKKAPAKTEEPETDVEETDGPDPEPEPEPEPAPEPVPAVEAEKAETGKGKKKPKKEMAEEEMADSDEEEDEEEMESKADYLASVLDDLQPDDILTALSEAGLIERMPELVEMPSFPLGGALSIPEAEAYIADQNRTDQVHDNFGLFMTVMGNIMSKPDDDEGPGKLALISQAIGEFGDRIDALKSGLADAYLLQPAAVDIDIPEVETKSEGENIMTDKVETQVPETQDVPQDAYGVLKAAVDNAKNDPAMNRQQKAEAIQKALGDFVGVIRSELDQTNPADVADVVAKALEPIAEKLALMEAKMSAPQPEQPQQKSLAAVKGSMVTGPSATDMAAGMSIRDIARRSVGLQ